MTLEERLAECLELDAIGESGAEAMHDALLAVLDVADKLHPSWRDTIRARIAAELTKAVP